MSKLIQIEPGCKNSEQKADVIFIHGLGGDAFSTWKDPEEKQLSWINLIATKNPNVCVWSLEYAAAPHRWFSRNPDGGHSMAIERRAREVLLCMQDNNLGKNPILFVCHSLGGLVVKALLRISDDPSNNISDSQRLIATNTRAVFFLATPHTGSDWADIFSKVFGANDIIKELKTDNKFLYKLYEWYRLKSDKKELNIETVSFCEDRGIEIPGLVGFFKRIFSRDSAFIIVNKESANPGVGSVTPLDENHISITKARGDKSHQYKMVERLLKNILSLPNKEDTELKTILEKLISGFRKAKLKLIDSRCNVTDMEALVSMDVEALIQDWLNLKRHEKEANTILNDYRNFAQRFAEEQMTAGFRNDAKNAINQWTNSLENLKLAM